ncbi:MAG TPA: hypothetical protein DIC34_14755 [Treponema sp.]|nr:hypothetical protein [Treponema sp.]
MSLTPVMTQMDYYFTYPGTSTLDNLKIYFGDSGATGYSVYFDDIALERAPNPLAAPANLQANVNGTSVALSWDAVPGATRYSVECSSAASHSVSVSTQQASTSYTDNGCDSNTTYTYIVYALTDNAISPASEVTVTTGQGPALTGTLSGLPLADGTWQALLKDGNWRTHKTTLTVSGGSAAFTVYAGVPNLSPDNLVMWLDSDGDGGETIETGDIVARVDAGYTWDQATGTASGLNFTNWETMGNATAIVIAIQQDSNIELNWMEPRCTGSILRRVQQSTDAANWADISAGSGGDMDSYWCNFSFGGTESGTYYWRVGVDANGNGSVDADEYGLPSAPLSIIVPPGTVGITVQ